MSFKPITRRSMLATGAAIAASSLIAPAQAQSLAPTETMRGGANNYRPGAPIVDRIGGGGFWMTGTVRRAAHSHGATLTDADGVFRLEMPQIVPAFGQAHGHLAYDSADFAPVFLRPVMGSSSDTSLEAHFVLQPA